MNPLAQYAMVLDMLETLGPVREDATFEEVEALLDEGEVDELPEWIAK